MMTDTQIVTLHRSLRYQVPPKRYRMAPAPKLAKWRRGPHLTVSDLARLNFCLDLALRGSGIERVSVFRRQRWQRFVMVRHLAMYLARRTTRLSYPKLGKFFERDHVTVMNAEWRIERRRAAQPLFAAVVERLIAEAGQ